MRTFTAGTPTTPARIRRARTLVRVVLGLGITASIAANILAAQPSLAGRLIAAWPPAALLLTMELITRIPVSTTRRAIIRISATTAVAGIAAWVSYGHMREVAAAHGESATSAALLPLSVDGLIVVASICLMDLTHHTSSPANTTATATKPALTQPSGPPQAALAAPDQPTGSQATKNSPARVVKRPARASEPTLAIRIAQLKSEHPGWTQKQLADAAGCTIRTIRRHTTPEIAPPAAPTEPVTARQSGSGLAAAPPAKPTTTPALVAVGS